MTLAVSYRYAGDYYWNYEIKLFNHIADRKGGDWTTYRVEVNHPQ